MIPILMLAHNRLEMTKQAVASVLKNTERKFHLCILDNGSEDGTEEWLRSFSDDNVDAHFSTVNLGVHGGADWFHKQFPDAQYYAKVDNDTLVPSGWLNALMETLIENEADLVGSLHYTFSQGALDAMNLAEQKGFAPFPSPGGSGVLYTRKFVEDCKVADHAEELVDGWTRFCVARDGFVKGFSGRVRIELLDMVDHFQRREAGDKAPIKPPSTKIAITPRNQVIVEELQKGMRRLKWLGHPNIGDEYNGDDEQRPVHVKKGETCDVSEKKAQELLRDFGGAFIDVTSEVEGGEKTVAETPDRKPKDLGSLVKKKSEVKKTVTRRKKQKAKTAKQGGKDDGKNSRGSSVDRSKGKGPRARAN